MMAASRLLGRLVSKIAEKTGLSKLTGKVAGLFKRTPRTIPANVQGAAQRLGVDLNTVQIENGVLRARIGYLTDTRAIGADVQTLVDFARQQGARTAVIDTQLIQHPILSDWAADPARVSSMLGRPAQVRVLEEATLPFLVNRHGRMVSTTSTYRRVEITVPLE